MEVAKAIKKERKSNLELYRIIVMLLIVAHHYVVNSGLWQVLEENELNSTSYFLYFFGMWGKTGIDCFVLITGYFMCKSVATVHKFLKLLLEVVFYKVSIYLVFLFAGIVQFDIITCFWMFLPISNVGDGFMTGFLLFYLFIPFLNRLILNMDRRMHLKLILLSLFIYTIWDTVPTINVTFNYVTWFIILYFISSFIRLYPVKKFDQNIRFWGIMTLALIALAMTSVYVLVKISWQNPYFLVSDSNALFAIAVAISSFMFFKNLIIKPSRLINTIAASMLGVLLIHAHSDAMRQWLWVDILENAHYYSTPYCVAHAILSVVAIFIICVVIDHYRIQWIEKPLLNSRVYQKLVGKIEYIIK